MLKRIPKSDISVRPFKAYKDWSFNQDSTTIELYSALKDSDSYAKFDSEVVDIGGTLWSTNNLDLQLLPNGNTVYSSSANYTYFDASLMQVNENMSFAVDYGNPAGNYSAIAWVNTQMNPPSGSFVSGMGYWYNYGFVDNIYRNPPAGWRMPTTADFDRLISYLGGSDVAGGYLKNPNNSFWTSSGFTNISYDYPFDATPSGIINAADAALYFNDFTIAYTGIRTISSYWAYGSNYPYYYMAYNNNGFYKGVYVPNANPMPSYQNMMAIRLIKDDTNTGFTKKQIYGNLHAQFYNGQEDNPILRFGKKSTEYNADNDYTNERYFPKKSVMASIPQRYFGDQIKPESFKVDFNYSIPTLREYTYVSSSVSRIAITSGSIQVSHSLVDDGNSNLIRASGSYTTLLVSKLDFQTGEFNFDLLGDLPNNSFIANYSCSVDSNTWNNNTGDIVVTYQGIDYNATLINYDDNTNIMLIDYLEFFPHTFGLKYFGNVFYSQGAAAFTRFSDFFQSNYSPNWKISYKSSDTIYEHEYLVIVNEEEFNVSTNPSAYVSVGMETGSFTDSDGVKRHITPYPGVKYIRKKITTETGEILDFRYTGSISSSVTNDWVYAGFEHYEMSGSVDKTGSFLMPFITTIGLYDDDCTLVAVAKLPTPIKSLYDYPVNFIVRFDT